MYQEGDENAVHIFARHMRIKVNVTVFSAINISGRFSPSKRTEREGCHVSGSEERDTLHLSDSRCKTLKTSEMQRSEVGMSHLSHVTNLLSEKIKRKR